MVRVFIALWNVECGLQELKLHMPVFVDAFVLVTRPPREVILQRRRELPQIGLARVLTECPRFRQLASLVLQRFLPSTHRVVDMFL
jgi:hypothetical protein